MAQHEFNGRACNTTRTYPGTAARVTVPSSRRTSGVQLGVSSSVASNNPVPSSNRSSSGSASTMFTRPLSRSQLSPGHSGGSSSGGRGATLHSPSHVSTSPSSHPISLNQPRPTSQRHGNVYLGAPVPHQTSVAASGAAEHSSSSKSQTTNSKDKRAGLDLKVTAAEQVRLPTNSRIRKSHSDVSSHMGSIVTSQPTERNQMKRELFASAKEKLNGSSITCPYCRKCRCEACATPRPLPSGWICSKSIHCGPEQLVDYLTCLCCVKAIFYHCGKNHEPDDDVLCADKPCSCSPHRKFWRWGCMTVMSVALPCLCLYWPCRGCIVLAEKAYQKYHNNGCICHLSSTFESLATPSSEFTPSGAAGTDISEDEYHPSASRYKLPPAVTNRSRTDKFHPLD